MRAARRRTATSSATSRSTQYTRASIFAEAGKQTPVFVRFSTVLGERGSTDTARDVRGFAVKFYTDEGNWDLVGNNIPVFFIQDAMKFPDLVHAAKPEPHFAMPQAASAHDTFWDFASLMPEITHMLMWAMSDRAIPAQLPHDAGVRRPHLPARQRRRRSRTSSSSTGTRSPARTRWCGTKRSRSPAPIPTSTAAICGKRSRRAPIPEYELGVQIFTEEQAEGFTFDVLDATKIVPEELVPVFPVGKLVLNRNPDNFFAETEQVAFCTAHVVPGVDFSNDPLLAGRIHSYVDTQISRLGGAELPRDPDQRAGRARSTTTSATACTARRSTAAACPTSRTRSAAAVRSRPARWASCRSPSRARPTTTRCAASRSASPTTTPRRRSSGTARRRSRRRTSSTPSASSCRKVQTPAIRERMVSGLLQRRARAGPGRRRGPRHPRPAAADAEGAAGRRDAGGHRVAGAVAVRAAGRRQHPDAPRRHPGRRRLRRRRRSRRWPSAWPRKAPCRASSACARRGRGAVGRAARSRRVGRSRRRRCSTTRSCSPTARPRSKALAATGRRWSSSRTSTATARRSWRSGRRCGVLRAAGIPDALPDGERRSRRPDRRRRRRRRSSTPSSRRWRKHRHFDRETDPPRV